MICFNDLSRSFNLYKNEYEKKTLEVLRSGWYILGKEVEAFENEYACALGEEVYFAGVDNGLDAILLGLIAAGIKPGDEIIVQANGYIATILGIIQCGGIPVFIEPDSSYQLDPEGIEKSITSKTKAVLVTHLYGLATEMDPIIEICSKNNLLLFEDCAQSHFAKYNGINTGLFGDASFFSFYPTKNMGGFGDGGGVASKNKEIIDKVKVLRNYGSDYRYHNIELGYNARLDELQAGLLRVKLKHIEELLDNRRRIAFEYLNRIKNPFVSLPCIPDGCTHVWYQFVIRVDNQKRFIKYMEANEIKTDISWEVPPYLQPIMKSKYGYKYGDFPKTEEICDSIVSIPIMDVMYDEEINHIINTINKYNT